MSENVPAVRILINEPSNKINLNFDESFFLVEDGKEIKTTGNISVSSRGDVVEVKSGSRTLSGKSIIIRPADFLTYENKKLTGDIKIISSGNLIHLINTPSIEDYLKGVIPYEMPLGRGMEYYEGLKAFAICARTFTVKKISEGSGLFDVRTDVRDQVYGGLSGRKEISDRVVDDTRGLILNYNKQPAVVFYFSTCGGRTEDVENVFSTSPKSYLKSLSDGDPPYCSISPQSKWNESFSAERIIALLKKANKISSTDFILTDMRINSKFRSGRVNELEIIVSNKSEGKKSVRLFGNNIRVVLLRKNNQPLNSNYFEIEKSKSEFLLRGKGWGHGTGLCQWGALAQSLKGRSFEQILSFYFPGTQISRYYD